MLLRGARGIFRKTITWRQTRILTSCRFLLRDVDGRLDLLTLPELRELDVRGAVRASDSVAIEHVCHLPADRLLDVTSASGNTRVRGIGCCTQSAIECPTSACACE